MMTLLPRAPWSTTVRPGVQRDSSVRFPITRRSMSAPGHRGDAQRHLPQRLLDASCRHDHGVVESRELQRDRGQLDEIARDRHALHRRRAEAGQEAVTV